MWDGFASHAPGASVYHLSAWKDVIESTFGHRTHYLAALEDSRVVGILPLVHLNSRLFGNMLVSLPYFNYGGICSTSDRAHESLFRAAVAIAGKTGAASVEIREAQPWSTELPCKTHKVSMRLTLPAAADELWQSFPSKLRSQAMKPRKEGLTATVGGIDQLDAFYGVFASNMRDLGTPVYPKAFFGNILRHLGTTASIAVVYQGTTPLAAGFLVGFRERLEIPWASSLRSFNRLSPNMLLYWTCLEFACNQGYKEFDFGRSTPGEGTYRFKEQWGAKPHPLYWYYWLKPGKHLPEVNPDNPRYRAAISLWRRLPIGVTRYVGPRIIKYIPA